MKKAFLLLLGCAIAVCACQKTPQAETPSKDASLTGTPVNLEPFANAAKKIFVLNEGGLGSNNASLDLLRFEDSQYITGVFKKMNPAVGAGLGDVGNDIAVHRDEVWIVVNNSGIVEVLSAKDETEIAAIPIPTPRNIAFDDKYAYVTSWAGAFASYGQDYSLTDYANRQWAGLIKSYYKPRWMMFCRDLINSIEDGNEFNVQRFDERIRYHEVLWTEPSATKIDYNAPGDPVELSKEIINKYGF